MTIDSFENKYKIGIILVNFNGKLYNEQCINSIKLSTYSNYSIYVVDNNSSDNSVEILKEKFRDGITIIENDDNLGFSCANNIGIKKALDDGCNYILMLNNDTVIENNMIEEMLDISLKNHGSVVSPKIYYYDNKHIIWSAGGNINWVKGLPIQYGIDKVDSNEFSYEREVQFATGCCILIPKGVIEKIGLLSDKYFLYYEDTDYSIRMINGGVKIIYAPNAKMYHKVSASTGGSKSKLLIYYMTRNRLLFNKKFNKKYIISTLYFYITFIIKSIIWIFKGEAYIPKTMIMAIKDFYKKEYGKKNF